MWVPFPQSQLKEMIEDFSDSSQIVAKEDRGGYTVDKKEEIFCPSLSHNDGVSIKEHEEIPFELKEVACIGSQDVQHAKCCL